MKARREELKLAREEAELMLTEDAIFAMDKVAGLVALEVNNVPARFTRDLEQRAKLQTEIDAALTKVADCVRECGNAIRSGRDADPAVEEDDA